MSKTKKTKKPAQKQTHTLQEPKKEVVSTKLKGQAQTILAHQSQAKTHDKKTPHSFKQFLLNKKMLIALVVVFFVSIFASYLVFNLKMKLDVYQPTNFSVEFMSPYQATVFFKTKSKNIFYLKAGSEKTRLDQVYRSASKNPTQTHVIEVGQVPRQGLWIKFQVGGESNLVNYFMPIEKIIYQSEGGLE